MSLLYQQAALCYREADSRSATKRNFFSPLSPFFFQCCRAAGCKAVIFVSLKDIDFGVTPSYLTLQLH